MQIGKNQCSSIKSYLTHCNLLNFQLLKQDCSFFCRLNYPPKGDLKTSLKMQCSPSVGGKHWASSIALLRPRRSLLSPPLSAPPPPSISDPPHSLSGPTRRESTVLTVPLRLLMSCSPMLPSVPRGSSGRHENDYADDNQQLGLHCSRPSPNHGTMVAAMAAMLAA